MARLPRLTVPGLPHHVLLQALRHEQLARDDNDRERFIAVLSEAAKRTDVTVHAYVVLPDQVQLLVTPNAQRRLSGLVQILGRAYVAWFNTRHRRTGTLWQGRFRNSVIEPDPWVLRCMRFIDTAPVRAGLVAAADQYPWSSARVHLGQSHSAWLIQHEIYWALGNTPFEREAAYRKFLLDPADAAESAALQDACRYGWALGSAAFVQELGRETSRRARPGKRGRPKFR